VAQKVQILLIDDLDGSQQAEETVRFGLDGAQYEIDLTTAHAGRLRAILARHAEKGRKAAGAVRRPARNGRGNPANGLSNAEIRVLARKQGIEVKDRGRLPAGVVAQVLAATGK
jgi:hypothetical protein